MDPLSARGTGPVGTWLLRDLLETIETATASLDPQGCDRMESDGVMVDGTGGLDEETRSKLANKSCVNHEHATLWRNLGSSAFMTNQVPTDTTQAQSCVHGHTYDEDNPPYVNPNKGTRSCRRCTRNSKLRSRGIDPTTVPYKPYRRGNTECRAGHGYDTFGFKDYGEGRICNECIRITSAKANLKKAYGLTFDDVARMLAEQGHACATCLEPFTEVNLDDFRMGDANVDHCHTGSHNRGLLCMGCNIALGKVKDNVKTLARMIEYLEAGAGRAADRWS
ncbi:endonuclease domain-containing protein [Streptomyces globisporus]|uniref:endonuclease domain-containing protein n=1 Tax=Streptomyces globisporus TaxID=1908 RepID=UPI0038161D70